MDYNGLKSTATRMLGTYGMPMVHVKRTPNGYDVNSSSAIEPASPLTQVGKGIVISGKQRNRPGSTATEATTNVMVDAKYIVVPPSPGDEMIFGGVTYSIVTVDNLAPAGIVLAWELGLTSGA